MGGSHRGRLREVPGAKRRVRMCWKQGSERSRCERRRGRGQSILQSCEKSKQYKTCPRRKTWPIRSEFLCHGLHHAAAGNRPPLAKRPLVGNFSLNEEGFERGLLRTKSSGITLDLSIIGGLWSIAHVSPVHRLPSYGQYFFTSI